MPFELTKAGTVRDYTTPHPHSQQEKGRKLIWLQPPNPNSCDFTPSAELFNDQSFYFSGCPNVCTGLGASEGGQSCSLHIVLHPYVGVVKGSGAGAGAPPGGPHRLG